MLDLHYFVRAHNVLGPTDGIIPILPMKFRKIKSLAQGKADKAFRPQRPLEARGFLR